MSKKKFDKNVIVEKFLSGEYRLIQERNDFFLPQAISFIEEQTWQALIPEYQRRPVWDEKKKSLFIESLIMNVPIPPIFLFEHELGKYEIMDGQQRTLAIRDFYAGKLTLIGLEAWPELNGKKFSDLPSELVQGLARRRISATTIINETIAFGSKKWGRLDLRREVFSRLNSGGVNLSVQELRNSLYSGKFNTSLIQLAGLHEFTSSWGIPSYDPTIKPFKLAENVLTNTYYKRMRDCEFVLRFFTLRDRKYARGSIKGSLDQFMVDMLDASDESVAKLSERFTNCSKVSKYIFGRHNYSVRDDNGKWVPVVQAYDAIMLAIDYTKLEWNNRNLGWKAIGADYVESFETSGMYKMLVDRRTTFEGVKKHRDLIVEIIRRHV